MSRVIKDRVVHTVLTRGFSFCVVGRLDRGRLISELTGNNNAEMRPDAFLV